MLPPRSTCGLVAARSRFSMASSSAMQVRHFWPLDKRITEWSSQLDPAYNRINRHRCLNTRAKLLRNARRRSKFDWEGSHGAFFTPKHIRLASHYHGSGRGAFRPKWQRQFEQEADKEVHQADATGHELSAREKLWQYQMERMRRRVDTDPYGAIFGKRFEPFWAPLFPKWMRGDLDMFKGEPPEQHDETQATAKTSTEADRQSSRDTQQSEHEAKKPLNKARHVQQSTTTSTQAVPGRQPSSYAYSSSTSWDSWTNKTRKTEWDSLSGKTKNFEYDPISNRMIPITTHATTSETENLIIQGVDASSPSAEAKTQSDARTTSSIVTAPNTRGVRKAIPIPSFTDTVSNLPNDSVASQADCEGLTAQDIRASMGKRRAHSESSLSEDPLVYSPRQPTASSHWDHAEQFLMLEQELESLQAKKANLMQEERRAFHFGDLARRYEKVETDIRATMTRLDQLNNERIDMSKQAIADEPKATHTSLQRAGKLAKKLPDAQLRSAIDRMQSKPSLQQTSQSAGESSSKAAVPKSWSDQAELLQADRIKRTTSRVPYPDPAPKWVDDMLAKQEAYKSDSGAQERSLKLTKSNEMLQAEVDRQKLVMKLHEENYNNEIRGLRRHLARARSDSIENSTSDVQTSNAIIQELQDFQKKAKTKITALRQELDIAYQQSSRHADEFRGQIDEANGRTAELERQSGKYKSKLATMRENLDISYRQSSKHADELRKQIQDAQLASQKVVSSLQAKINDLTTVSAKKVATCMTDSTQQDWRGEGDVCSNVTKYAGSGKWYKKPMARPSNASSKKAEEKALVREIRDIYENAYGVIGHEVQSQLDLGQDQSLDACLKRMDKQRCYGFHEDGLEAELGTKPPVEKSNDGVYTYKKDNLEAELSEQPDTLVKDHDSGVYRFRDDGLEAQLSAQSIVNEVQANSDDLKKRTYGYRDDGLEAELMKTPDAKTVGRNRATLRERLAADLHDVRQIINEVKHGQPTVTERNPIDGMTPATGNYASPTGFVNHDPVFPADQDSPHTVKRQERVFSGMRRGRRVHWADRSSESRARRAVRRRRFWRRVSLAMLLTVALTAPYAYYKGTQLERDQLRAQLAYGQLSREYERRGERGLAKAFDEMQQQEAKRSNGLFWK